MSVLPIVLVVCLVCVTGSSAIKCYQCSADSASCGDPFSASSVSTCSGDVCLKVKATQGSVSVVGRECVIDAGAITGAECSHADIFGVDTSTCYCTTDYCNSTPALRALPIVPLLLLHLLIKVAGFLY